MRVRQLLPLLVALAVPMAVAGPVDVSGDPARSLASQAAGQELAAGDPRVTQAKAWLRQVAAATGEEESFVATTSTKVARYLFDLARVRAQPLEVLEALAKFAPAGKPIGDTTQRYVDARRNSPGKTHAEAMAAMAGK